MAVDAIPLVVRDPLSGRKVPVPPLIQNCARCARCEKPAVPFSEHCWDHTVMALGDRIGSWWRKLRSYGGACDGFAFNDMAFDREYARMLPGKEFRHCSFANTVFFGVDFSEFEFDQVDFTGARFEGCFFTKATFRNCRIGYVDVEASNLRATVLRGSTILRSLFGPSTVLSHCDFSGARFESVKISSQGVRLKGADFRAAAFRDCSLAGCDFRAARTDGMQLVGSTDVSDMRLTQTQLRKVERSQHTGPGRIRRSLLPLFLSLDTRDAWHWLVIQDVRKAYLTSGFRVIGICAAAGLGTGLIYCLSTGAFGTENLVAAFRNSAMVGAGISLPLFAALTIVATLERNRRIRDCERFCPCDPGEFM